MVIQIHYTSPSVPLAPTPISLMQAVIESNDSSSMILPSISTTTSLQHKSGNFKGSKPATTYYDSGSYGHKRTIARYRQSGLKCGITTFEDNEGVLATMLQRTTGNKISITSCL